MTTRTVVTCDQCGAEGVIGKEPGWHNIGLNDYSTSRQRQIDLCPKCWTTARIPELMP